ncbi:diguanylate cyclase [Hydrogenovibrio sp. SC-1]|uniref:putative bifunctional diguanylate cyclase/phosphodiesterase n=1 Tax=Hydrogenovibrio sp. SC-1 TaxID=2065820 RepID=UPI000C7BE5E7|nr:EAL domain-containing protein [Hydrogenovibrio sp. SC-1]PLA75120.1 diguanylate cyclase [Hydrogenovibrio sp. SC-1]
MKKLTTSSTKHQAQHDALTQLPNRLLFVDRVEHTLSIRKRLHQKLAVLFLDLDRFKEVNDSFGHEMGDKLIQKVAIEIRHQLRDEDTIARFGGDEFAILIHQYHHPHDLIIVVEKILSVFRQAFIFDEIQLFSTCGIGIATFPENGADASTLMKNADAAMYKAKKNGQNRYEFYNHDMTKQAYERVNLERELRYALTHNELEVYYQPQIDMSTQKVLGLEILMRWNHPQRGLISPDQFIPFAEEIGLIVEMDRWAMEVAMKQVYRWQQQGLRPGKLSLNLSLIQLNQVDFLASVQHAIAQSLMVPQDLIFEITETQIMRNPEQATRTLTHLKELGLSLAIDDFGTGHSSLSYLKNFPIDKLKIDQSFVHDMTTDKDDANLVKAIINIAKSLEMDVIAEGVETQDQVEMLINYGCYEAQGFYYSKPLTKTDFEVFLKSH